MPKKWQKCPLKTVFCLLRILRHFWPPFGPMTLLMVSKTIVWYYSIWCFSPNPNLSAYFRVDWYNTPGNKSHSAPKLPKLGGKLTVHTMSNLGKKNFLICIFPTKKLETVPKTPKRLTG